jgi:hypothetical protein
MNVYHIFVTDDGPPLLVCGRCKKRRHVPYQYARRENGKSLDGPAMEVLYYDLLEAALDQPSPSRRLQEALNTVLYVTKHEDQLHEYRHPSEAPS